MNIQLILVVVLVAGAAFYLGRSLVRSAKGHACESGDCKCTVSPAGGTKKSG